MQNIETLELQSQLGAYRLSSFTGYSGLMAVPNHQIDQAANIATAAATAYPIASVMRRR